MRRFVELRTYYIAESRLLNSFMVILFFTSTVSNKLSSLLAELTFSINVLR